MTSDAIETFRFRKSIEKIDGKEQYHIQIYDSEDQNLTNPLFSFHHWDSHVIDPIFESWKALVPAIYRKANREILDKLKQNPQ